MSGLEIIFFGLIATIAASSVVWVLWLSHDPKGRPPVGGVETWIGPVFSDVAARLARRLQLFHQSKRMAHHRRRGCRLKTGTTENGFSTAT